MEKAKHLFKHTRSSKQLSHVNFRRWVIAFVVCNFNVDVGPEIELVCPTDTHFSKSDLSAICFNSFPERQDTEAAEDLTFHFIIRNNSPDIPLLSPCAPHGSAGVLYGHCLFRQEYDSTTKRGFNQKTLVLISNHDFPSFFHKLLQQITSTGVISNPASLEAAYSQIEAWPPPSVGRHELPFMGSLQLLEIGPHASFPLQGLANPPMAKEIRPAPIYAYEPTGSWHNLLPFMSSLSDLHTAYEKLLLCESVIVLAKSPQLCSEFVSALIDLVRPVPYAGTCRPYLTMQSEFFATALDGGIPRHFLIGITNPFLLQRIQSTMDGTDRVKPYVVYLNQSDAPVPLKVHRSRSLRSPPSVDMPGGVSPQTTTKRYFKTDHAFFKNIDTLLRAGSDEVGSTVRRHFAELTAQFLAPLHRYLATNMSPSAASPGGNPQYAHFSEADFLHSLSKHGTSVKFKGQNPIQRHRARDALYSAFCRSPNFYSWLDMKLSLEKDASAGLLNSEGSIKAS